eukprot:TRINITY_DN5777_c0_g1_i3.p1 TRINITY_DN5777_c0_g1~~TRINITY_DN5777_c0_g1_i3.p1  ORF type:complete len:218 (-),score=34.25 TRINITY_DN5777_c0_g1_i3:13-666(-)
MPEASLCSIDQDASALPHRQLIKLTPQKLACRSIKGRFLLPAAKNSGSRKITGETPVNHIDDNQSNSDWGYNGMDQDLYNHAVRQIAEEDCAERPLASRGFLVYNTALPELVKGSPDIVDLRRSAGPDAIWLYWARLRFPAGSQRGQISTGSVDLATRKWTKFARVHSTTSSQAPEDNEEAEEDQLQEGQAPNEHQGEGTEEHQGKAESDGEKEKEK